MRVQKKREPKRFPFLVTVGNQALTLREPTKSEARATAKRQLGLARLPARTQVRRLD